MNIEKKKKGFISSIPKYIWTLKKWFYKFISQTHMNFKKKMFLWVYFQVHMTIEKNGFINLFPRYIWTLRKKKGFISLFPRYIWTFNNWFYQFISQVHMNIENKKGFISLFPRYIWTFKNRFYQFISQVHMNIQKPVLSVYFPGTYEHSKTGFISLFPRYIWTLKKKNGFISYQFDHLLSVLSVIFA